jgi:hypothetical protein
VFHKHPAGRVSDIPTVKNNQTEERSELGRSCYKSGGSGKIQMVRPGGFELPTFWFVDLAWTILDCFLGVAHEREPLKTFSVVRRLSAKSDWRIMDEVGRKIQAEFGRARAGAQTEIGNITLEELYKEALESLTR